MIRNDIHYLAIKLAIGNLNYLLDILNVIYYVQPAFNLDSLL